MTFRRPLILLLMLFTLVPIASAQDATSPLYLWSRGDLYVVTDLGVPPARITEDGTISGPIISRDGQWIAYKTASALGRAALDRVQVEGLIASFDLPADIVLFNTLNNAALPIAVQPEDASLLVPGQPDRAIMRSAPSWSTDNSALAWIEIDYPTPTAHLVRYDLDTASQSRIASFALPTLIPPPVLWGDGGIAVDLSADASSDQFHMVYNPADGSLVAGIGVASVPNDSVRFVTWVEDATGGRSLFAMLYESGGWTLIDPATNTPVPYSHPPLMTTFSETSNLLRFGVDPSLGFYWELAGTNAAAVGDPNHTTLSPDGSQLAVVGVLADGKVSVFTGADMLPVTGTGSGEDEIPVGITLWGDSYWTVTP